MGCHFLLPGIFPTQGSNLSFLHCRWILCPCATWEALTIFLLSSDCTGSLGGVVLLLFIHLFHGLWIERQVNVHQNPSKRRRKIWPNSSVSFHISQISWFPIESWMIQGWDEASYRCLRPARTAIITGVNKVRGKAEDGMTPQENGELVSMGKQRQGRGS